MMGRIFQAVLLSALFMSGMARLPAQDLPRVPVIDSLLAEGMVRTTAASVLTATGLAPGVPVTYRDLQRAVAVLMSAGQFDDVQVEQRTSNDKLVVIFKVKERPILRDWSIVGNHKLSNRSVAGQVRLVRNRAIDRDAVAKARWSLDSMYQAQGYYASRVWTEETPADSGIKLTFHIQEGDRVVISRLEVQGNSHFTARELSDVMSTRPESFWWFDDGKFDEREIEFDVRDRLPRWYGKAGMVDFQVLRDSLVPAVGTGKAVLHLNVEEGPVYSVGKIDISGNQHYSQDEVARFFYNEFPAGGAGDVGSGKEIGGVFDQSAWERATNALSQFYLNTGYINAWVQPEESRRTTPDGRSVLDLRWRIKEGMPAHINKIRIVGNNTTHESVIRDAIILVPGQLYSQDGLIRSYQNISNLGFFEQPLPYPDREDTQDGTGSVDIIFRVVEKHTGMVNFGASLGQGTGLGGFLGLEEPNLFGRGKAGKFNWNFGKNVRDISLTYSDPAINSGRLSGSVSVYSARQRYIIGDLGRQRQEGIQFQVGAPLLGSRFSRLFVSYGFQRVRYDEGSAEIQRRFQCAPCSRSTVGLSFLRETRIGLPFPVGGAMTKVSAEQNGGILGGSGDYRKLDVDTRWYAPLGTVGGKPEQFGSGVQFTLGITAKSGFIFGNPGGFFTQLYSLGGVQYGIPLRGYDEFSITPDGFDPNNGGSMGSANAFGKAYAAATVEFGARLSQSLYLNAFFDAGNVYRNARQYDPTRLFRGAGVGAAMISPLGPMGLDLAYGFDKIDISGRPKPGWQLHLKFGNMGF